MRVVDAELISIDAVTALAQGGDGDDKATAEEMKLKDTEAECLARLQAQQVLAGFCLTTQHLPGGGGGRFPPQPPPPPPSPTPLGKLLCSLNPAQLCFTSFGDGFVRVHSRVARTPCPVPLPPEHTPSAPAESEGGRGL